MSLRVVPDTADGSCSRRATTDGGKYASNVRRVSSRALDSCEYLHAPVRPTMSPIASRGVTPSMTRPTARNSAAAARTTPAARPVATNQNQETLQAAMPASRSSVPRRTAPFSGEDALDTNEPRRMLSSAVA
jgi:hypothetical protein